MKANATIFTVAIDDDGGTSAAVFATQHEAVKFVVCQCIDCPREEQASVIESYYSSNDDFYERIKEYKSEYDTYSIEWHELELEVVPLDAPQQGALTDVQKQDIADNHGQVSYKGWEAV